MTEHSSELNSLPPADESAAPASLSVDQLTQAFAQLLGEQPGSPAVAAESAADSGAERAAGGPDDDEDAGYVTPAAVLEAILFVGHPQNEPLTARLMASYLRGVSPQEVDALIEELNLNYREQGAPYQIESQGAGYRMTLCPEFLRLREQFYGKVREAKLTQAAVDLLAIVAYHQPIARDRVDQLRNQPSGGLLSQLVRRQLLQVEYTTEKPRRQVYRTTDRFLDLFGLDSIADLPSQDDF